MTARGKGGGHPQVGGGPRASRAPAGNRRRMRTRRHHHEAADLRDLAEQQGGVVSRRQAYDAGITRSQVRANLAAQRWRRVGSQSLALRTGPLSEHGKAWAAVFEAGPRAMVDGASALILSGLRHFDCDALRISVPRGVKPRRGRGLNVRQTRRLNPGDRAETGVPRTRPEVAAVRAALWARSDRQAALVLTMTVQQGLATAERIAIEMLRVRRDKRRAFVHLVLLDLLGGVRSLGELDFANECRRRGLPEPTRQAIRRGRNGSYYLDVYWEQWHLVVEIDGIHHGWADQVVGDAIRHNDLALSGDKVLRLPLLGLRAAPDDFFAQIESALIAAGCPLGGDDRSAA